MNTKVLALKTATCTTTVPAIFSHGKELTAGKTCQYKNVVFRNGENHIVLPNNKTIPACFFQL